MVETTVDATRRPASLPTPGGWYDPDGTGFQAEDESDVVAPPRGEADEDLSTETLVVAGSAMR